MAIIVVCGVGAWPASYAVASETSALRLRAKTQGIGWFAGSLATGVFSIILPYIFNRDEGNLKAKTGFLFAGLCLVGFGVTWSVVPELKGLQATEIDKFFESALPTKEARKEERDSV